MIQSLAPFTDSPTTSTPSSSKMLPRYMGQAKRSHIFAGMRLNAAKAASPIPAQMACFCRYRVEL